MEMVLWNWFLSYGTPWKRLGHAFWLEAGNLLYVFDRKSLASCRRSV
jgi:hypothetical protein